MTFGSLFAGIGGLDLGLERAGMQCKWQVEIDDYATRVLERHWPNVRRWRDVETFPPDADEQQLENWRQSEALERFSKEWSTDLICGGFPCQDISYAGCGAGLSGARSGLFFEALRVVRQLQPRYVLLENVAALLTRGLDRVLGELAEIGYDAEWHCIPAAAVGAPHIRDRVFIISYANEQGSQRGPIIAGNARKELAALERSNREQGGQWSTEPDVGRVANGISARVGRLRGLGNAVVPQVAEYIGRMILQKESSNGIRRSAR